MSELADITGLGKTPIAGESPVGASVQFDEDYEKLRAEMQKLDSVTGETVEWSLVENTGVDILQNRSKHLLVGIYLSLALFERHDYAGLAAGFSILRDLVTTFWDTMEPPLKRKRGRIEGFVWLCKRLGTSMPDRKPTASEMEAMKTCKAVLGELGAALNEKLADDAPGLADLERLVNAHIKDLEAAVKAAETRKAQAEKVASGDVDDTSSPDDARKVYQNIRTKIAKICQIIRRAAPQDPIAYRLLRASTWGPLQTSPPDTSGVTQIPAPGPEIRARLDTQEAKAEWGPMLETIETAYDNSPLWLDLQHYLLKAFDELGEQYDLAAEAVRAEIVSLLRRLPDLTVLEFAGGVPFADPQTRKYLDKMVKEMSAPQGGGPGAITGAPPGLEEAVEEARRLAGKGKLTEAVGRMQAGISSTGEHRARFLWRLELARLCLDSGRVILAAPLLEELETLIDRHNLEAWEPDLCKTVYTALLSARRLLLKDTRKATPELIQKTNLLQDRLSRLDPTALLSME